MRGCPVQRWCSAPLYDSPPQVRKKHPKFDPRRNQVKAAQSSESGSRLTPPLPRQLDVLTKQMMQLQDQLQELRQEGLLEFEDRTRGDKLRVVPSDELRSKREMKSANSDGSIGGSPSVDDHESTKNAEMRREEHASLDSDSSRLAPANVRDTATSSRNSDDAEGRESEIALAPSVVSTENAKHHAGGEGYGE